MTYDYDVAGNMLAIREAGAASGAGVLAKFSYDNLGNRLVNVHGNGSSATYTPDAVSRLTGLTQNMAGTGHDLTLGLTYNPASQITSETRSDSADRALSQPLAQRMSAAIADPALGQLDHRRAASDAGRAEIAVDLANVVTIAGVATEQASDELWMELH